MPTRKAPAAPNVMEVEVVDIESVVPDDRNARRGNVASIIESLREFGQHRPIVCQRDTKKVLIGNHTLAAAKALGWTEIAVHWVDDDDEKALRRALADNLTGDQASWDDAQLKVLLLELDDMASLPGLEQDMVDKLLSEVTKDEAPPPLLPIVAKPSERYSYVVVISTNEVDETFLRAQMGLIPMKSYKSQRTGVSRVITVDQFKAVLNRAVELGQQFD